MASKSAASTALLLSLKILFFTVVSSFSFPNPLAATPGTYCPKDTLKIGACVNVLKIPSLLHLVLGRPPPTPECCPLIAGLADLEAAVCLCTTIKLNVLSVVNLNIPIDLSLILNNCGKQVPKDFECA